MKSFSRILATAALAALPALADHLTIPSGAEISVRTNQSIDSEKARVGDVFDAEIVRDVTGGSRVVIPKGAPAKLVLRELDSSGSSSSRQLMLDLESVQVDGRRYEVGASTEVDAGRKEGLGKNKRTGKYAGGGAAVGAIIGGIAGGGKGAVLGGLAGAAAGATAQVLTRGDKVRVPAETVLNFRLEKELRLESR